MSTSRPEALAATPSSPGATPRATLRPSATTPQTPDTLRRAREMLDAVALRDAAFERRDAVTPAGVVVEPVRGVSFVVRVGERTQSRFVDEAELAARSDLAPDPSLPVRGAVVIEGATRHLLAESYVPDLPALVGELRRALERLASTGDQQVTAPGRNPRLTLARDGHAVVLAQVGSSGRVYARRGYAHEAFACQLEAMAQRLESALRERGLQHAAAQVARGR